MMSPFITITHKHHSVSEEELCISVRQLHEKQQTASGNGCNPLQRPTFQTGSRSIVGVFNVIQIPPVYKQYILASRFWQEHLKLINGTK